MRTLFARLQRRQSEAGGKEDRVIDQVAALVLPVLNVQRNTALADKLKAMEDAFRGKSTPIPILSPGGRKERIVCVHKEDEQIWATL